MQLFLYIFSEEIMPIKMSSKSREGKICYCKVKVNQVRIQNFSSITILHYFSGGFYISVLLFHRKYLQC